MKRLKLSVFIILLSLSSLNTKAQYWYGGGGPVFVSAGRGYISLSGGDPTRLVGVTNVNIIYDYSHMGVGKFKYEEDYIRKKEDDYRDNPEKFERFRQSWYNSRKERYEPKFETLFNKFGSKSGIRGSNYGVNGTVTLKVETLFMEPGFNAVVAKMPAYIDLECTFMNQDGKEIVRYTLKNIPGTQAMGFDYDAGSRLAESYAKAAKMLMKEIHRSIKRKYNSW